MQKSVKKTSVSELENSRKPWRKIACGAIYVGALSSLVIISDQAFSFFGEQIKSLFASQKIALSLRNRQLREDNARLKWQVETRAAKLDSLKHQSEKLQREIATLRQWKEFSVGKIAILEAMSNSDDSTITYTTDSLGSQLFESRSDSRLNLSQQLETVVSLQGNYKPDAFSSQPQPLQAQSYPKVESTVSHSNQPYANNVIIEGDSDNVEEFNEVVKITNLRNATVIDFTTSVESPVLAKNHWTLAHEVRRDSTTIRLALKRHNPSIKNLYNIALRKIPTLQGRLTICFQLDEIGRLQNAKIVNSTLVAPEFERQVLTKMNQWRDFGYAPSDAIHHKYMITFLFESN